MDKLDNFKDKPFFTVNEASLVGISPRMLCYYVKIGKLERLARGVYVLSGYSPKSEDIKWEDLAVAASNIDGGVVCLVSALIYYKLTDEFMKELWIAVSNDNSKAKFPMCRIIRMRNMSLGVTTVKMSKYSIKIFDRERTIVDSFRLLDLETALKALKIYMTENDHKPNIRKLLYYSKQLRVQKIKKYIEALAV